MPPRVFLMLITRNLNEAVRPTILLITFWFATASPDCRGQVHTTDRKASRVENGFVDPAFRIASKAFELAKQ